MNQITHRCIPIGQYHQITCIFIGSIGHHRSVSLQNTIEPAPSETAHPLDFMAPASDHHVSLICFLGAQGAKAQKNLTADIRQSKNMPGDQVDASKVVISCEFMCICFSLAKYFNVCPIKSPG